MNLTHHQLTLLRSSTYQVPLWYHQIPLYCSFPQRSLPAIPLWVSLQLPLLNWSFLRYHLPLSQSLSVFPLTIRPLPFQVLTELLSVCQQVLGIPLYREFSVKVVSANHCSLGQVSAYHRRVVQISLWTLQSLRPGNCPHSFWSRHEHSLMPLNWTVMRVFCHPTCHIPVFQAQLISVPLSNP